MEMKDLLELKALEGNGMSPYEQYKVGYMQTKSRTSGVAIAGLVLGTVGTAAAIGSWVFSPIYGAAKANQAKEVAIAAKELANVQNQGLRDLITTLAGTVAAERAERIAGDQTITQTVNDTQTGSQSGQLTAMQQAELNATQQLMFGLQTGQYSQNPLRVVRVSGTRECPCDSGCGCNG